jgi:hypothetical protein
MLIEMSSFRLVSRLLRLILLIDVLIVTIDLLGSAYRGRVL